MPTPDHSPDAAEDPVELADLLATRVLFVTGKGGVGKSTVAAALAVAGARSGRATCLVEVEGRQTMQRLFDTQQWDFTEREFRPGLWGMSIDPRESFAEYMEMFYGAKRLSKVVVGSSAVDFATTAAPGIKDVLLIGKVKEIEERRRPDGRFTYDLVVVDSPPTGRIVNFLRAPDATTEMVNMGPIRTQAQGVVDMLTDPRRTHLQLVTILEEMPVVETLESAAALTELGVAIGPVVVNRVQRSRFDEAELAALDAGLDPDLVQRALRRAGVDGDVLPSAADHLSDLAGGHRARLALQQRMRSLLESDLDLPTLELPYVASRDFGDAEIAELAELVTTTLEAA